MFGIPFMGLCYGFRISSEGTVPNTESESERLTIKGSLSIVFISQWAVAMNHARVV